MAVRESPLLNFVLYQTGWFACVLGAALHHPWAGSAVALLLLAAHFATSAHPRWDARLVVVTTVVGLAVELAQIAVGTYSVTSGTVTAWLPPVWLLLMWAQFATTFRFTLRPVMQRPFAAALFGAVGGPLAFIAGEGLGAVTLQRPVWFSLLTLAVSWGVAMTMLSALAHTPPQVRQASRAVMV